MTDIASSAKKAQAAQKINDLADRSMTIGIGFLLGSGFLLGADVDLGSPGLLRIAVGVLGAAVIYGLLHMVVVGISAFRTWRKPDRTETPIPALFRGLEPLIRNAELALGLYVVGSTVIGAVLFVIVVSATIQNVLRVTSVGVAP